MYLSCLSVRGCDRDATTWLSNPYRVHQRLLMAWEDGAAGRVLFRIDYDRPTPRIIVQSATEANWGRAFRGDAPLDVLAGPPIQKPFDPLFEAGQRFRFLLRGNPTKRLPADREGDKLAGKRVSLLREDEQRAWLDRKALENGFQAESVRMIPRGVQTSRRRERDTQRHLAVDFEGILSVMSKEAFRAAITDGIGAAKGFGFGLLSLAQVK